jgi:tetratricopeptide (TPR) repeat protein
MSQRFSCPNCGAPVAFGARFCGNCGTQLNWPAQGQVQPPSKSEQIRINGTGLIGKALVLINEGKCDEALQYIDKALEMNRNLPIAWSIKGEALHRLNRFQEAIECYSMAITLAPLDSSDAIFGRGLAYEDLGNYERALEEFEFFRSLYPEGIVGRYFEGVAHSNLGHYEQAMKTFDQAIKLIRKSEDETKKEAHDDRFIFDVSKYKSWSALMWTGKGQTLIKMGRLKEALTCLKKAVSDNPDSATYQNLGSLYQSLGCHQDAKRCNDKATEIGQTTTGRMNLHQSAWLQYVVFQSKG